ncbi:MAG: phasin family protein, partial [Akkermansiaceae bacterium]|nr:phasin family protein [Akkermansiaceae bacterium]
AAAATKSVQEAIELQNEFFRTAFERNVGQVSKLADHWTGVAKEAATRFRSVTANLSNSFSPTAPKPRRR